MNDGSRHQLVVLGAGPGGYTAAFLAADLGMEVVLIDKDAHPGGVCLHRGCIPSKALLHASEILHDAKQAEAVGITFGNPQIDLMQLRNWKETVVHNMVSGLGMLAKRRNVTYIQGTAAFKDSHSFSVTLTDGQSSEITFEHCILATGSSPMPLPGLPFGNPHVWDSTDALALNEIPERLLVVGGGVIGLELGSVYASLGSRVSVVEMTPGLLPGTDRDLVQIFLKSANQLFESIMINTKLTSASESNGKMRVRLDAENGPFKDETFDKILASIGRKPNSSNIGLENTQVHIDDRGFVRVNDSLQTDDPSIYAIGDLTEGPLLAHKASSEGRTAVEVISGKESARNRLIPGVVYTSPEIATVGLTETVAKAEGKEVKVVKFPWQASGRAAAVQHSDGVTKLFIDPATERILGVGIAGKNAGEMITEGTLAIRNEVTAHELASVIHPHPTLSETLMEACESFYGTSTHIYRPIRK